MACNNKFECNNFMIFGGCTCCKEQETAINASKKLNDTTAAFINNAAALLQRSK